MNPPLPPEPSDRSETRGDAAELGPAARERIQDVFHGAIDLPADERTAFLADACAQEPELRERVERLLAAYERSEEVFEAPLSREIEAEFARLKPEEVGDSIGAYKLREKLGEGGFGTVWVAEQERPVRRRVALKILKMGMDTNEVIGRFEQERQALAMMDHPNIARVFDAGATPFGRPFFAMELVRGVKITEYCDQQGLSTKARLELFIEVSQAVQHAHQKGIIHRDLKPSNILVTVNDGRAVPKVIDFGVAKATLGRLTDRTVYTQLQQMVGTPLYMSPEQAELTSLDIDTRSDIYSLGVLLYELLTGHTPIEKDTLARAGFDEIRRIIREVDPLRPSLRFKTLPAAEMTTIAKRRCSEPGKLSGLLRGDLDWIVMKCLEKDRKRRYETANGLALDVHRYLANQPVSATPPSVSYRFRKFARRNKLGLSAAAAVVAALVIGFTAALWQANLATREANRATSAERNAVASEGKAVAEAARAEESEQRTKRFSYAADMNLVQQALRENNIGLAHRLLDRHRPETGKPDLRGWEWRYLWQECRSGAQVMLEKREGIAVFSESFSRDGALLLVGYADGQVDLWNVATRKLEQRIQESFGQPAHVAFSPTDDSFAATMGRGAVKTVNVRTGAQALLCTIKGSVRDLSYSRDGKLLALLSSFPDQVMILRAADGSSVMNYPLPIGVRMFFNNVRISPDKQKIYVSCGAFNQPTLLCVSVADKQTLWEVPIGPIDDNDPESKSDLGFSAMDLSPDGDTLVVATGYRDPRIRVLDTTMKGEQIARLEGHTKYVLQVAFSADGRVLASTSEDQTIRLWDTATWTQLATPLRGHNHEVNAVAFSSESHFLASGNKDGEVFLWDIRIPPPVSGRRDLPTRFQNVVALSRSRMALGQTSDGKWSLIDLLTLTEEPLPASDIPPEGRVPGLAPKKHLPSWPMRRDRVSLGLRGDVSAFDISPDGKLLVAVSDSGEIGFYDTARRKKIDIVRGTLPSVFGVTFSPNGQRLVLSHGGDRGIELWDVNIRQELVTLSSPDSILSAVEFTEDGNTILCRSRATAGSGGGAWQFWHAPSWQEIEDAERIGGPWPQMEAFQPPPPAPTLAELKNFLEAEYVQRLAQARAHSPEEPERLDEALENLADFRRQQHRYAEAEELVREMLERLKERTPRDDSAVLDASTSLLGLILSEIQTERDSSNPQRLALLSDQSDSLVNNVVAIDTQMSVASPDDTDLAITAAVDQIWFEQKADYQATVRRLLDYAEQHREDDIGMERAALACCLSPIDDPVLRARVLELAQNAVNLAGSYWRQAWSEWTLGLAFYRSGQFAKSEDALKRAEDAANRFEGPYREYARYLQTSARFIRSAILRIDGNGDAAKKLFAEAQAEMKPLPADHRQAFEGSNPYYDMLVWLSFKEARKLLE